MQSLNRLKSERPRKEYDFYETPHELCKYALMRLLLDEEIPSYADFKMIGLDAGAGNGIWGKEFNLLFRSHLNIGVDINPIPSGFYDEVFINDFLKLGRDDIHHPIDIVYGNPPYSLAEEFVRKGMELIYGNGSCVFFLLRLAFLESKKRHFGLFSEFPPKRVYVLSRRPSFFSTKEGRKTTDALSYAMFLWQKGWEGKTELDWLYWEYDG